jgi:acyl carrier protein
LVTLGEISQLVKDVLQLGSGLDDCNGETPLLGGVPEFDSMAVVSVITAIEDNYGIIIEDDEVSAEIFETLGSLCSFVQGKVGA